MPRGRPSTPTALKIVRGNPGRRPLNRDEPTPPAKSPRCPSWLSKDAKAEWRRIVPELEALRLLTVIDQAALAAYCQAVAELKLATEAIDAAGRIVSEPVVSRAGEKIGEVLKAHPAVKLQRDAMARVKQFLGEFGLSPSSRPRLKVPPKPEAANPLQELLARRGKGRA